MLDLEITQMDIKGAYINGNLKEEIYMHPHGFTDRMEQVCRLKHTLYSLKQSGCEWNKRIPTSSKQLDLHA